MFHIQREKKNVLYTHTRPDFEFHQIFISSHFTALLFYIIYFRRPIFPFVRHYIHTHTAIILHKKINTSCVLSRESFIYSIRYDTPLSPKNTMFNMFFPKEGIEDTPTAAVAAQYMCVQY